MKANRVYIAGPMSNHPKFNVPAFLSAQKDLIQRGLDAILPVDMDIPSERAQLLASKDGSEPGPRSWATLLSEDLKLIGDTGVEGIVVLPGWQYSKGAKLETYFSRLLGLEIVHYPSLKKVSRRDLQRAHGI
jgi:Domain of unknown function (DUF4406)